ncbi:MAG: class I SAM-dependent methyltransferase [Nitrospirales bacterium]|nr:class I SAM-dependent methyltransferase [Nitrospira sp.]MDR4501077.1 class I SAM-dependent methyltransferase [Nitrospirales bacterium]
MKRVLEPELMDDLEQAQIYASADFAEENQTFVDRFLENHGRELDHAHVLDLGCGPGDILIRLVRAHPTLRVTGVDASQPMIDIARQAVNAATLNERIELHCQRFQDITLSPPADAVISNSLAHHVPNPLQFWYAIKTLAKSGAPVLVMDLIRPESSEEAHAIVDQYASDEPEQLRQDFYNSLLAAFTEDEVAAHLAELNLSRLLIDVPDDRHWIVEGRVF